MNIERIMSSLGEEAFHPRFVEALQKQDQVEVRSCQELIFSLFFISLFI